jgi:hypothetical protein
MNETTTTPDRFRIFVLVLTLLNTIFAVLLSGLQVDANIRADTANRDSQYFGLLATNEVVHFGRENGYEFQLLLDAINEAQRSQILTLTALDLEEAGETESAAIVSSQSQVAEARSEKGTSLSLLLSDPRYAASEPGDLPDVQLYLDDQRKTIKELEEKQNAASDEYYRWDSKADGYITALTVLPVAFFSLGLAQSTGRLRQLFAFFALAIMLLAAVWTGFVLIS